MSGLVMQRCQSDAVHARDGGAERVVIAGLPQVLMPGVTGLEGCADLLCCSAQAGVEHLGARRGLQVHVAIADALGQRIRLTCGLRVCGAGREGERQDAGCNEAGDGSGLIVVAMFMSISLLR